MLILSDAKIRHLPSSRTVPLSAFGHALAAGLIEKHRNSFQLARAIRGPPEERILQNKADIERCRKKLTRERSCRGFKLPKRAKVERNEAPKYVQK